MRKALLGDIKEEDLAIPHRENTNTHGSTVARPWEDTSIGGTSAIHSKRMHAERVLSATRTVGSGGGGGERREHTATALSVASALSSNVKGSTERSTPKPQGGGVEEEEGTDMELEDKGEHKNRKILVAGNAKSLETFEVVYSETNEMNASAGSLQVDTQMVKGRNKLESIVLEDITPNAANE